LAAKRPAAKPQRTREHVIADLSFNYLERRVLLRGFVLDRVERDYGLDAAMFTYSDSGEIENGDVRFQLKATDRLSVSRDGKTMALRLETGHIRYWAMEPYPVIVILYDAKRDRAYWLDIQKYVERHNEVLDPAHETVTVRIPTSQRLDLRSIDTFRNRLAEVIARFVRDRD
jgi:Domain of unknown function (DUF4365)